MISASECLETLKCSICDQLLSLFPIYLTKNEENQLLSVCGRCKVPDVKKYLRDEIYEALAKTILFPCINSGNGCMENLLPEDVKQHELICSYQLKKCILDKENKCKWQGHFIKLVDHCKSKHNHLILENNEFEIEMNKTTHNLNLLQYRDEAFVFKYNFDQITKRFKCSINPLGFDKRTKKYYAQLCLKSEECTIMHDFPEIDFNETNSKSLDINVENMSNIINNTTVIGMIKITTKKAELHANHDANLPELKCSVCSGILYPPVYQCTDRHYACSGCFNLPCVPTDWYTSRPCGTLSTINDALKFIHYQCQYGCGSIIKGSDLEIHYSACLYKPYSCLLINNNVDCKWKERRKDVVQHIFQEHKEKTIKINEIISLPINIKSTQFQQYYRFLKYSGNSFKIVFQYRNPHLLYKVETVDSTEASSYFKFEIMMFDKNNMKLLTFRESCSDLSFVAEYSIKDIPCVWLHVDQINNSVLDNALSFKVNIFK